MAELTPLSGWRVIAEPGALDGIRTDGSVVRISPDDALILGGGPPQVGDEHAIVTPEHGFSGCTLSAAEVIAISEEHIEWQLPDARPAVAQGQIAGVPAKLVLTTDGRAQLLVACAAAAELAERLGWR